MITINHTTAYSDGPLKVYYALKEIKIKMEMKIRHGFKSKSTNLNHPHHEGLYTISWLSSKLDQEILQAKCCYMNNINKEKQRPVRKAWKGMLKAAYLNMKKQIGCDEEYE